MSKLNESINYHCLAMVQSKLWLNAIWNLKLSCKTSLSLLSLKITVNPRGKGQSVLVKIDLKTFTFLQQKNNLLLTVANPFSSLILLCVSCNSLCLCGLTWSSRLLKSQKLTHSQLLASQPLHTTPTLPPTPTIHLFDGYLK